MIRIGVKKLGSAIEPSLKHLSEAATLPCRKVVVLYRKTTEVIEATWDSGIRFEIKGERDLSMFERV